MRTKNSVLNSLAALLGNGLCFLTAFIAQALFIKMLGKEYLGLNGLFSNVLAMLSIFELGIGSAIVYNLYKPIADNDVRKISALMNFYKKAYRIIATIILLFGIAFIPFIKYIVNDMTIHVNIYIVYLLFLISTVVSYLIVYKRNLIIANQQNYIISIVHTISLILLNVFQLSILFFTKNYYLYLILKIIFQLIENISISLIATKKFAFLEEYKNEKIDQKTEKDIFNRVKALFFHKVGTILVLGTDNIIISMFFGIGAVGLYSNYNIIMNAIKTLFGQIITTTTASVGNLLVTSNTRKKFEVFKKIRFFNFWISLFTAVSLLVLVQPFITVWIGKEYQLDIMVVGIIAFNFFQTMQRSTYNTFKDSAGIWIEDRFVPIIESLLNIVFSIICLKIFGLIGVFIGTLISGLILWCYSYPKYVYKKLFDRTYLDYYKETTGYIILFIIISLITYYLSQLTAFSSTILQLFVNAALCIIIPNTLLYLIFKKTENYKYFKDLIIKIFKYIKDKYSN